MRNQNEYIPFRSKIKKITLNPLKSNVYIKSDQPWHANRIFILPIALATQCSKQTISGENEHEDSDMGDSNGVWDCSAAVDGCRICR